MNSFSTPARFWPFVTSPSSHFSPNSHAFFNLQTGIWIYRSHTTRKALCRRRTALPHHCLLQVNADELRQIPVTVVAHVGYARYERALSFSHNYRRTWRSMAWQAHLHASSRFSFIHYDCIFVPTALCHAPQRNYLIAHCSFFALLSTLSRLTKRFPSSSGQMYWQSWEWAM